MSRLQLNPISRVVATTVALILHDRGLEREWVARVVVADEETKAMLERGTKLTHVEVGALNRIWRVLSTEAAEKLKAHQKGRLSLG